MNSLGFGLFFLLAPLSALATILILTILALDAWDGSRNQPRRRRHRKNPFSKEHRAFWIKGTSYPLLRLLCVSLPLCFNTAPAQEFVVQAGKPLTNATHANVPSRITCLTWTNAPSEPFITLLIVTNLATNWTTFEELPATNSAGRVLTNIVHQKQWGSIQTNRELVVHSEWEGKPRTNFLNLKILGRQELPSLTRTNKALRK